MHGIVPATSTSRNTSIDVCRSVAVVVMVNLHHSGRWRRAVVSGRRGVLLSCVQWPPGDRRNAFCLGLE